MVEKNTYADIHNGNASILIATDLIVRGIDFKDINVVINYEFPVNIENYFNRLGITGRAEKTGSAITLFT